MKSTSDFLEVIKTGVRVSNKYMVVHYKTDKRNVATPLVGFVVPKKQIPKAVNRNRIKRQLRHVIANHINQIPQHTQIVIRILKDSQGTTSTEFEKKFLSMIKKAEEKTKNREIKTHSLDTEKNN